MKVPRRNRLLRLARYAELVREGATVKRILWELSISERTMHRYAVELRNNPDVLKRLELPWACDFPSYTTTARLLYQTRLGAEAQTADGVRVSYAPRCVTDSRPWVTRDGTRPNPNTLVVVHREGTPDETAVEKPE